MQKLCSSCGIEQSFDCFSKCARNSDGLQYACRRCSRAKVKASRTKYLERYRQKGRDHYHANAEVYKARSRKRWQEKPAECLASNKASRLKTGWTWRKSNPEKALAAQRRGSFMRRFRKHGLTVEHYEALKAKQNFCCAACKLPPEIPVVTGKTYSDGFMIDHDHTTRRVRGLLCVKCNVAVGMLDDSVAKAQGVLDYITAFDR